MGGAGSGSGGFLGQAIAGTTQLINGFASALPVVAQQGAADFLPIDEGALWSMSATRPAPFLSRFKLPIRDVFDLAVPVDLPRW